MRAWFVKNYNQHNIYFNQGATWQDDKTTSQSFYNTLKEEYEKEQWSTWWRILYDVSQLTFYILPMYGCLNKNLSLEK